MSQIIYPITHLPPVIDIGKQTEKGVTRIGFDVHEWLDDWPGMVFSVQPTRPGETESYFAESEMVGSVVFWLVGAVDTEKPGSGTVEVLGVTEDERKLSFMCRTSIANTNTVTTAEIPEPNQPWVDQVILAGEGAKESAQTASQAAQEATRAADAAGQDSANADAQAASAAKSATNAAQSATEAYQSFRSASGAAATAVQSATEAVKAQGNAEGHATTAGNKAQEAATSAENAKKAADEAKEDAEQVEAALQKVQEDYGNSSLYIVTAKPNPDKFNAPYADKTQEEIRAAVAAGKTCVLVYSDGRVFTYYGEESYSPTEPNCPMFVGPVDYKPDTGLNYRRRVLVRQIGNVALVGSPIRTPNPNKLTLTGAVEAEYDGSEKVTVEIPSASLPETADPLKQLVTDKDGNVAWEDRLAYKTTAKVENLAATALVSMGSEGFALTTPWAADVVAGTVCTVNYNGADYDCTAVDYSATLPPESELPEGMVLLGNASAVGLEGIEGANADAPFALLTIPNAPAAETGVYAQLVPMDGATSVTLAVSSVSTVYKTIDPKYLPNNIVNKAQMLVTIDVATFTIDKPYADVYDALLAGKPVQIRAGAEGEYSVLTPVRYNADYIGLVLHDWDDEHIAKYKINSDGTVELV